MQLACVLEVSAAKPGNITPAHDFSDTTYADMVRSALALGPVFARDAALRRTVGELIADGVEATAQVAGANTNLGIVLLFAPLVRAEVTRRADEPLRAALERTLAELDVRDAAAAFAAIARANPGGLGEAPEHDVRAPARVSLREAMQAAAHRDSVASEYATGYAIVFDTGLPLLGWAARRPPDARGDRVTARRPAGLPPGHPDRPQGGRRGGAGGHARRRARCATGPGR